ncbi:MAG TPA: serine/threonine-protein kinase, partial [Verrucomicrobiae bacterium]|nr:serine/threonine-protein kinase [Verrucomicrobiae bacterium]
MNLKTESVVSGDVSAAQLPLPPEKIAPHFPQLEILECLGRGGMGVVYKARQKSLNRLVALKLLAPERVGDSKFAERFTREAQALAALNHPNIVTIYDFGQAGGFYFLLMEFVDGMNLRRLLRTRKFTPEEALAIVPPLCDALQFAHERGIVHRDIKPENILLDKTGRVKVADFGIAKMMGNGNGDDDAKTASPENVTQSVVGTPAYSAPEQKTDPRRVDSRADIYSLGVVFYEMLTGELPEKPIVPPSRKVQLDVRLDEVVLRALETKPELRFQQASAFKTQVETIAQTAAPGAKPSAGFATQPPAATPAPLSSLNQGNNKTIQPGAPVVVLPAVALIVAAAWKLFSAVVGMFAVAGIFGGGGWLGQLLENVGVTSMVPIKTIALMSLVLFKIVPAVLIFYGGYEMLRFRSHAWAVAAAIIAIVACSLIGLPVGIWSLIVLGRRDVRDAFGKYPALQAGPAPVRPGNGTTAFAIVAGALVFLLVAGVLIAAFFFAEDMAAHQTTVVSSAEIRENFQTNCPLAADGVFSLDNVNGRTDIIGGDGNEVVVKGVKRAHSREALDALKIDVDSQTNRLAIHTRQPESRGWGGWFGMGNRNGVSVDYTVQVPWSARLQNIDSVNGSVTIAGVTNDIRASTVNGEM